MKCSAEAVVALMSDERFCRLRTVSDRGFLLYDELDAFEMPEGYTKEQTWRILLAIRKQAAIFTPDDPYRLADCWFVTTSALAFDSKMLEMRCMAGFPLDDNITSLKGSPFITRSIERVVACALEAEDAALSDAHIHALFVGGSLESDIDQVVSNFFGIYSEIEKFASRDITQGLIETLYYRLIENVATANLPRRPAVCPLDARIVPPNSQECLSAICRRVHLCDGDFRFGPVLRILNVSWFFWNFEVFPYLNSLVGILLRNVMALKWRFPVLSWLPMGYYPFGDLNTPRMQAVFNNWSVDYGFGFDFTAYYAMYVKLYLEELDRLEASLEQLKKLNKLISETFDADLHDRQKSILSAFCKEPDALLRIGPHQRTFQVAYATARSDFLDLERKGYVVRDQCGKAFVFRACPDLREKIVRLGEAAFTAGHATSFTTLGA